MLHVCLSFSTTRHRGSNGSTCSSEPRDPGSIPVSDTSFLSFLLFFAVSAHLHNNIFPYKLSLSVLTHEW